MSPTRAARSAAVPAATLALLLASGLAGCGGDRTTGEPIPPVLMTDADGVVRGPDPGAEPVTPPDPAPAGDPPTETETRREQEPAPTTADTPEPPPPPPPPPPAEDSGVDEPDDGDLVDDVDDSVDDDSDDGDDDG